MNAHDNYHNDYEYFLNGKTKNWCSSDSSERECVVLSLSKYIENTNQ